MDTKDDVRFLTLSFLLGVSQMWFFLLVRTPDPFTVMRMWTIHSTVEQACQGTLR